MEHDNGASVSYNGLPPLSPNYPWLVTQCFDDDGTGGQIFYPLHDPQLHYRCRVPELLGKRIRGFFYGWVILSENLKWSLWNPSTSKVKRLPPLNIFDDKEDSDDVIRECCLTSPPDDPSSVLLLTRARKSTFVFCRLADRKRKWIEMSYANQLKRISIDGSLVHSLTCCNGKVYALNTDGSFENFVINIDIAVKENEVVMRLFLFGACPFPDDGNNFMDSFENSDLFESFFMKGSGTELFGISVVYKENTLCQMIDLVSLYKLETASIKWGDLESLKHWDVTNMSEEELEKDDLDKEITKKMWEELSDLKDATFLLDLGRDYSIFYNSGIASELGGYIHIRTETGKVLYSYNLKDKSISLTATPSLVLSTSHVSLWECSYPSSRHKNDTSLCSDGLPLLCDNYSWLVSQVVEDDGSQGQIFYAIDNPRFHYKCRVPELVGKRVRGIFHGWVVLSNILIWSLWNPSTSEVIRLPLLNIFTDEEDSDDIRECCLSSPPGDSRSVLLLTRSKKSTFIFCRVDCNRKRTRWIEMSYAKQLKNISFDSRLLHSLTFCNGEVYALSTDGSLATFVVNIDIMVNGKDVIIKLLSFGSCPWFFEGSFWSHFLKGYGKELFCIIVGFKEETRTTIDAVSLFKLDVSNMWLEDLPEEADLEITGMWERMLDLKSAIFFVDLGRDCSTFYNPAIASKLGGYIHIRGETGEIIQSYHLKDKTISPSSLVLPTSHVSWSECRLQGDNVDYKHGDHKDDKIVIRSFKNNEVDVSESVMSDIPFDVLEIIMKFCVGVEYMNFRATCKHCHLAAPLIHWKDTEALKRLRNYSLISPLLMVVDRNEGIITFTDPLSGDKYFMTNLLVRQIKITRICCSRFGWLLLYTNFDTKLVLYNLFTSDIRELPYIEYSCYSRLCFSAPPTSHGCRVVKLKKYSWSFDIHLVGQPSWREIRMETSFYRYDNYFPTFYGQDLYVLCHDGDLYVIKKAAVARWEYSVSSKKIITKAPTSGGKSEPHYFLTTWGQALLLVMVCDESIKVYKFDDETKEWRKIDGIGRHMIYICDTTCLCVEAKIPEMENKIYLPQVHSENEKIVFYSLETGSYNTFNGKCMEETFCRIRQLDDPHTWIEPSWS